MEYYARLAVLGIVQGLTEFLPVSSSAHLVFAQRLLAMEGPHLFLDVLLHAGTTLALVIFLRRDIRQILASLAMWIARALRPGRARVPSVQAEGWVRIAVLVALASVPAGIVGVLFRDLFEGLFASSAFAGGMLLVTGAVLFSTRFLAPGRRRMDSLGWKDALMAGCAQAVAILPGISRSGMTLAALSARRLDREAAFRFAFLMAIPVMFGALAFELNGVRNLKGVAIGPVLVGALVAGVSGYAALKVLRGVVVRGRLGNFAYYCWAAGLAALAWEFWGQVT